MIRNPLDNPFDPLNRVYWYRTNSWHGFEFKSSNRPLEWGWMYCTQSGTALTSDELIGLKDDWNNRTYPVELDPHPNEEIIARLAWVVRDSADEFKREAGLFDSEHKQVLSNYLPPKRQLLN